METPTKLDMWSLTLSKRDLEAAPEDERLFHLMAGQLANELNILTKTILIAHNGVVGHEVQMRAHLAQTLYFVRVLAARLHQGWELIQKAYHPLHPHYNAGLTDKGRDALKAIKKHFGQTNIVSVVRNKMAAHADPETFRKAFAALPVDADLVDYFGEDRGHCLYFSAEFLTLVAMIELTGAPDWQTALDKALNETIALAGTMGDFVLEAMAVFVNRNLRHLSFEPFQVEAGPPIDKAQLPFFAARPTDGWMGGAPQT